MSDASNQTARSDEEPWYRNVPAEWSRSRLKATVLGCRNGLWGDEPDGVNDIICVRVADFDRVAGRVSLASPTFRAVPSAKRPGRTCRPGNLLLEKSGGGELQPVGAVVLYDHEVEAVCSNFVALMPVSSQHDPRFLCYLHSALYAARVNTRSIKQTTGIQNLDSDAYLGEAAYLPLLPTQRSIGAFLDRKTAAIDQLIQKKERLIELLREKRQALITQSVTKGLDPSVPMKESGLDWSPLVPAHWRIVRLSYLATVANGSTPSRDRTEYWDNGTIPWVASGQVNDDVVSQAEQFITPLALRECSVSLVPAGSVLVGLVGQGRTRGMSAFLNISACINQNVAAVVPGRSVEGRFLHLAFVAAYETLRNLGRGGQQDALNCEILKSFRIPLPPPREQVSIVSAADAFLGATVRLLASLTESLDRLREYRQALISAAVTGQIDVTKEAS